MRKTTLLSSATGLALCAWASASAAQYSITEIPQMTHAVGVNRNGVVVGSEGDPFAIFVIYVHSSGVLNELPTGFSASDVNDQGQIIGYHSVSTAPANVLPPQAAILFLSGGERFLPTGLGFFLNISLGRAISNSGLFAAGDGLVHPSMMIDIIFVPWRWGLRDDSVTVLPRLATSDPKDLLLGADWGDANAVNDEGVVVGNSSVTIFDALGNEIGTANHAAKWQDGGATDLGTLPGGTNSGASGINDHGEIVGASDTANGASHAYLLRRHKMLDLGTLGHYPKLNSNANRINDRGEIVGWSEVCLVTDKSVVRRAFVYSEGRLRDLTGLIDKKNPLHGHVTLTSANAISSNGWIAADGFDDATQEAHVYLLVPHGHEKKRSEDTTANDGDDQR